MRLPRSSHCTMLETSCDARAHTSAPSTGCSVPVAAAAAPLAARWALSNACTAPAKSSFRSCATSALRSARLSFAQCATRCLWSYSLRIFWTSLGGASPPLPYGGSSAPGSSTRGSTTRRATTIATAAPAAAPAARAARRSALAPLHSALARPHHAGPPIASRETPPGDDPTPRCGTPPPPPCCAAEAEEQRYRARAAHPAHPQRNRPNRSNLLGLILTSNISLPWVLIGRLRSRTSRPSFDPLPRLDLRVDGAAGPVVPDCNPVRAGGRTRCDLHPTRSDPGCLSVVRLLVGRCSAGRCVGVHVGGGVTRCALAGARASPGFDPPKRARLPASQPACASPSPSPSPSQ